MPEAPAIDAPLDPPADPSADPPKPKSLEDLLASSDDETKAAILGEVEKARKEAAGYRTKLREAEPLAKQAQALLDAQKSDAERAAEKQIDAELKAHGYRDRAVAAEVKALAATKFADPSDAAAFLELKDFIDDDGEIDTDAIGTALDALLKSKPHLGVPEVRQGLRPDPTQGRSGGAASHDPGEEFAAFIRNQLPQ